MSALFDDSVEGCEMWVLDAHLYLLHDCGVSRLSRGQSGVVGEAYLRRVLERGFESVLP